VSSQLTFGLHKSEATSTEMEVVPVISTWVQQLQMQPKLSVWMWVCVCVCVRLRVRVCVCVPSRAPHCLDLHFLLCHCFVCAELALQ